MSTLVLKHCGGNALENKLQLSRVSHSILSLGFCFLLLILVVRISTVALHVCCFIVGLKIQDQNAIKRWVLEELFWFMARPVNQWTRSDNGGNGDDCDRGLGTCVVA